MVGFRFPYHHRAHDGCNRRRGFLAWLSQFGEADLLPPVMHLHRSILPLAHQSFAAGQSTVASTRLQLQAAPSVPDHPVVADGAFRFQPENLAQFAGTGLSPVISPPLRPPHERSAGCAQADTLVPDTDSLPHSLRSLFPPNS